MRIGICAGIDAITKAQAAGFDYIEPSVVSIAGMTEEQFASACSLAASSSIRCEAFNVLFPGDIKVVGPQVDAARIQDHLTKSFERIAKLGAQMVVFGSGGARKCPDGWEKARAVEQFIETARIAGDAAKKHGLTIVVEPLNTGETNIINSVSEGKDVVSRTAHPNVKLLADWYHIRKDNEPAVHISEAGALLQHIHVINSNGRNVPASRAEDDYASFFRELSLIHYRGRMSIEGKVNDIAVEGPVALALLRGLAKEHGL
ncbi:MAG: sugar phosphate isomerase/epimerase family protein [Spirochaetota bacterium]